MVKLWMPFKYKVGTPMIKIGLSKYVTVETLIALPFISVEICVHEFDSITVL